jgi:long-chain acyl-CoA synthetase
MLAKNFPAMSLAQADATLTRPGSPFEIDERDIRGVRTRIWKNAPPTMRELFLLARAHEERTFTVYRDERVSYEAFARAALAIAAVLQEAGLQKGDRVTIAMRNLPEWPAAVFGCVLSGGIATLLNAWWTAIPAPRSPWSIGNGSSASPDTCTYARRCNGSSSAALAKRWRTRRWSSSKP